MTVVRCTFVSSIALGEMVDAMQHAPEQQKQSGLRAASLEIDEWRWSDTKTMDEALELARYGWEEGRQRFAPGGGAYCS